MPELCMVLVGVLYAPGHARGLLWWLGFGLGKIKLLWMMRDDGGIPCVSIRD